MPDPCPGTGNCQSLVANYPDYGSGEGGWRAQLIREGNDLARLGPQGYKAFFSWLVGWRDSLPASFLKTG